MATTAGADAYTPSRAGRARLLDPVNLVLIPAIVVLMVARRYGMVSRPPAWRTYGSLVLAQVAAVLFATSFPPGTARARPRSFLAITTVLGGLFLYTIGWGAVLAVTFIASAAVVIEADGSRYGAAAIWMVLATIVAGEASIALGLFPSMIPEPNGHGIAAIEAAVTVTALALMTRGQRDKELAVERQRQGEERFRALVQHASDTILIVGEGGTVKYASPAVERLLGRRPEDLRAIDIGWVDADHADAMLELFRDLATRPGEVDVTEVPVRRVDGTSTWVEMHVTNLLDTDAVGGYVCNMRDIGARRTAQLQLVHDAHHDPLTRLANRRLFLERLDQAWHAVESPADVIAVLFIDVDHFKDINDQLGHDVGDLALVAIANELTALLGPSDLVARYGGDEFTVLLEPMPDLAGAFEVAERIRVALSDVRVLDGEHRIDVSVGVALSRDTQDAGELLRHADQAMYCAKRNGRGRCEPFAKPRPHLASLG